MHPLLVTTASNCVAKVFPLLQTKHYSVLLLFFYYYNVPSVGNCKVESILLLDAPQAFYLADGIYHVVSRHPALRMKNDSRAAGFTISTLTCQACIVRPSCSSTFSFKKGDLVLTPDMDFCETHPLPLIASFQLTPSLDQFSNTFCLHSVNFTFIQSPKLVKQF